MPLFFRKEKHEHYTKVAKGKEKVKKNSKFTEAEQRAYARGRMDQVNEDRANYAYKNSSEKQRQAYKEQRARERAEWKKRNGR